MNVIDVSLLSLSPAAARTLAAACRREARVQMGKPDVAGELRMLAKWIEDELVVRKQSEESDK